MTLQVFTRSVRITSEKDTWEMATLIGDQPSEAYGLQRTVQCFTVLFLSSEGTDLTDLTSGGSFLDAIGQQQGSKDLATWTLIVNEAARKAHDEIVETQRDEGVSDDDELLAETRVTRVAMPSIDELEIEIQLVSRSRQTAQFVLPIIF